MGFREALSFEKPLQVMGVMNAYVAIMAEKAGYHALYLSGAGVSNFSFGLPDIGATSWEDMCEEARRVKSVSDLPLLVDIDTGWGGVEIIPRGIHALEQVGVTAVHIEDQEFHKKCGHLSGKKLVSTKEMCERIKAVVAARKNPDFFVIARTDAYENEGLEKSIKRAIAYREAGADAIFPEALRDLSEYQVFQDEVGLPVMVNLTEFGKTPLFTYKELSDAGIDMALYPLSAARAMNFSALKVLYELRRKGTQVELLDVMQSRGELYEFLRYHEGGGV